MMTKDSYVKITRVVFAAIAFAHLIRLVYGWDVTVGFFTIPPWASVGAIFFAGILALHGFTIVEK